jgi:biopolymer transport protein ExbB
MITTVGGLIVGILAMFGYNYLVSRIDRLSNELEADILEFVEAASK